MSKRKKSEIKDISYAKWGYIFIAPFFIVFNSIQTKSPESLCSQGEIKQITGIEPADTAESTLNYRLS